jgi:hypothetical protein
MTPGDHLLRNVELVTEAGWTVTIRGESPHSSFGPFHVELSADDRTPIDCLATTVADAMRHAVIAALYPKRT